MQATNTLASMWWTIPWILVAAIGLVAVVMAVRVLGDDAWDSADWWALSSPSVLGGLVFNLLFPLIRGEHDRDDEVRNGWIVLLVGGLWCVGGVVMCLREYANR